MYALFELSAAQLQSDRLAELAGYAAVSELCRDLGYVVADDFGSEFERRVVSAAAAQGVNESELNELLAPHLESVVRDGVAQMDSSLADLANTGNAAPWSALLARRDQVCFQMTMDDLTADLITAGSREERETARAERVQTVVDRFR